MLSGCKTTGFLRAGIKVNSFSLNQAVVQAMTTFHCYLRPLNYAKFTLPVFNDRLCVYVLSVTIPPFASLLAPFIEGVLKCADRDSAVYDVTKGTDATHRLVTPPPPPSQVGVLQTTALALCFFPLPNTWVVVQQSAAVSVTRKQNNTRGCTCVQSKNIQI